MFVWLLLLYLWSYKFIYIFGKSSDDWNKARRKSLTEDKFGTSGFVGIIDLCRCVKSIIKDPLPFTFPPFSHTKRRALSIERFFELGLCSSFPSSESELAAFEWFSLRLDFQLKKLLKLFCLASDYESPFIPYLNQLTSLSISKGLFLQLIAVQKAFVDWEHLITVWIENALVLPERGNIFMAPTSLARIRNIMDTLRADWKWVGDWEHFAIFP